jgi:hypothetical protein
VDRAGFPGWHASRYEAQATKGGGHMDKRSRWLALAILGAALAGCGAAPDDSSDPEANGKADEHAGEPMELTTFGFTCQQIGGLTYPTFSGSGSFQITTPGDLSTAKTTQYQSNNLMGTAMFTLNYSPISSNDAATVNTASGSVEIGQIFTKYDCRGSIKKISLKFDSNAKTRDRQYQITGLDITSVYDSASEGTRDAWKASLSVTDDSGNTSNYPATCDSVTPSVGGQWPHNSDDQCDT